MNSEVYFAQRQYIDCNADLPCKHGMHWLQLTTANGLVRVHSEAKLLGLRPMQPSSAANGINRKQACHRVSRQSEPEACCKLQMRLYAEVTNTCLHVLLLVVCHKTQSGPRLMKCHRMLQHREQTVRNAKITTISNRQRATKSPFPNRAVHGTHATTKLQARQTLHWDTS